MLSLLSNYIYNKCLSSPIDDFNSGLAYTYQDDLTIINMIKNKDEIAYIGKKIGRKVSAIKSRIKILISIIHIDVESDYIYNLFNNNDKGVNLTKHYKCKLNKETNKYMLISVKDVDIEAINILKKLRKKNRRMNSTIKTTITSASVSMKKDKDKDKEKDIEKEKEKEKEKVDELQSIIKIFRDDNKKIMEENSKIKKKNRAIKVRLEYIEEELLNTNNRLEKLERII